MWFNMPQVTLLLALIMGVSFAGSDASFPLHAAEHQHKVQYVGMDANIRDTANFGVSQVLGKFKPILRDFAEDRWPHYLPTFNSTDGDGTSCFDALEKFYGFENVESYKMVDSWGKYPDGLITRTPTVLGMYDQCINTHNKEADLNGRYCLIKVKAQTHGPPPSEKDNLIPRIGQIDITYPPYNYIEYGTCMPDACSKEQLELSLNLLHEESKKTVSVNCNKESIVLDGVDISFIVFCSIFLVLMLAGAALDYYIERTQNQQLKNGPLRFLLPFSVTTNLKRVFAINTKPNPNVISCLTGMRVMSMCWVVMGHQHMKLSGMKIYDFVLIPTKISTVLFGIIKNSDVSVDSFFFMSGLLVCYGVLKEMKKTGKLNIVMFYVHRIIRLTPPIAMCVWFYASVNRHMVSGPLAERIQRLAETCRENGWRDFTYLTNAHWDNYEGYSCMGQCWYTAVDTQIYLIAPLLILPLHYFKDMGRAWLYIVTLTSLVIPGAITNRSNSDNDRLYVNETYMTPWCRASSYIIGIWTGYIIFKTGNKLNLKKWQVVVGWTAASAVAWMLMLGLYNVNIKQPSTTQIIYEATHRAAWAACLGWVAIACHNGCGGIVNSFLSHPVWQPVSRLTYGLYLLSFELQDDLIYSRKTLFYFTHLNMIIQICGALFISGIGAVLLTLVAEHPILGLEKLLFERPGHGPDETATKKPQEPMANDNATIVNDVNELKQLSRVNENVEIEKDNAVIVNEVIELKQITGDNENIKADGDNAAIINEVIGLKQIFGGNGNVETDIENAVIINEVHDYRQLSWDDENAKSDGNNDFIINEVNEMKQLPGDNEDVKKDGDNTIIINEVIEQKQLSGDDAYVKTDGDNEVNINRVNEHRQISEDNKNAESDGINAIVINEVSELKQLSEDNDNFKKDGDSTIIINEVNELIKQLSEENLNDKTEEN